MQRVEIRQVRHRHELEASFDLWGLVFSNESREFFQERLDFDTHYADETTWIAKVDGVIASAIQIFPYRARLENLELLVGGIGSVATHPEYRGRGLAQEIYTLKSTGCRKVGTIYPCCSLAFTIFTSSAAGSRCWRSSMRSTPSS
ncbi:GNAT family N-acetyltransferase [Alicyclobacillus fastidiosus]|uniref:GNAT family N-acetyltransferase n=1 Tax=Alicyclobacillus fastidiosus TaxID=392011 RepID=A0ABY6ZJQ0_9BACL|nr:GNAT family N-acetyltransferase [Alicyclobacillus fastidiosus]WAH43163.1 GNAT family N-acetyltransferase [Alicyclobacillus fastidiosus]GMA65180.1 hypothetical protein GCM10025859_56200 [Alicyclobacillus fastidiosus]